MAHPPPKPPSPWSVKGVTQNRRKLAKEAAKDADMPVGEWLNRLIDQGVGAFNESAPAQTSSPGGKATRTEASDVNLAAIQSAIKDLVSRIRENEANNTALLENLRADMNNALQRTDTLSNEFRALNHNIARDREDLQKLRVDIRAASSAVKRLEAEQSDTTKTTREMVAQFVSEEIKALPPVRPDLDLVKSQTVEIQKTVKAAIDEHIKSLPQPTGRTEAGEGLPERLIAEVEKHLQASKNWMEDNKKVTQDAVTALRGELESISQRSDETANRFGHAVSVISERIDELTSAQSDIHRLISSGTHHQPAQHDTQHDSHQTIQAPEEVEQVAVDLPQEAEESTHLEENSVQDAFPEDAFLETDSAQIDMNDENIQESSEEIDFLSDAEEETEETYTEEVEPEEVRLEQKAHSGIPDEHLHQTTEKETIPPVQDAPPAKRSRLSAVSERLSSLKSGEKSKTGEAENPFPDLDDNDISSMTSHLRERLNMKKQQTANKRSAPRSTQENYSDMESEYAFSDMDEIENTQQRQEKIIIDDLAPEPYESAKILQDRQLLNNQRKNTSFLGKVSGLFGKRTKNATDDDMPDNFLEASGEDFSDYDEDFVDLSTTKSYDDLPYKQPGANTKGDLSKKIIMTGVLIGSIVMGAAGYNLFA